MITPYKHQITGAEFLSKRKHAILADEPRVGKTGTSLIASKMIKYNKMLVITTASGRKVWERSIPEWIPEIDLNDISTSFGSINDKMLETKILIIGWAAVTKYSDKLSEAGYDLIIADEAHYVKDMKAKRSKSFWKELFPKANYVWLLTGTPMANSPMDIFPALSHFKALPHGQRSFYEFRDEYCHMVKRFIRGHEFLQITGMKNLDKLSKILAPHMLQRTQQDVGITEPIVETYPIHIKKSDINKMMREIEADNPSISEMFTDNIDDMDSTSFSSVRKAVGIFKAPEVSKMIIEEFESGAKSLVVMAWHLSMMDIIEKTVRNAGITVVRVDGSTPPNKRAEREDKFRKGQAQVFLGQIVACGEAIDLSSSSDLLFAETSYVPKDMKQASLRITNHNQKEQPRIRIATLADSIDERIQKSVLKKIKNINIVEGRS